MLSIYLKKKKVKDELRKHLKRQIGGWEFSAVVKQERGPQLGEVEAKTKQNKMTE